MIFIKPKIKTYNSCDTIFMENFYSIMKTDDLRWLVKGFNEDSTLKLNKGKLLKLKVIWDKIFDEHLTLKQDQKVINSMRHRFTIAKLRAKQFWGITYLKLMIGNPSEKSRDNLEKWGFKFDLDKPFEEEVTKIISHLKSIKTKLNIEISKYQSKIDKYKDKEQVSIHRQINNIERILDMRYPIDQKITVMSKWISLCNDAKVKLQNNGRNN